MKIQFLIFVILLTCHLILGDSSPEIDDDSGSGEGCACNKNKPCQNSGTCHKGSCTCQAPYTGCHCELPIVDCVGVWDDWSDCNVTCGDGYRMRTHSITTNSSNGGEECCFADGEIDYLACERPACDQGTCVSGLCVCNPGYTGTFCDTPIVNCVGSWSAYSSCNVTCGNGIQTRDYTITTEASGGGSECTNNDGDVDSQVCTGSNCQNGRPCVNGVCDCGPNFTGTLCQTPVVDCVGSFTPFSPCNVNCGTGTMTRVYIITTNPSGGGNACPYNTGYFESVSCTEPSCQNGRPCSSGNCNCGSNYVGTYCETPRQNCVGQWTEWSPFHADCSASAICYNDERVRYHIIDTPASGGGKDCEFDNGFSEVINQCYKSGCQNGGTCNGGTSCICPPGITGTRCTTFITPICESGGDVLIVMDYTQSVNDQKFGHQRVAVESVLDGLPNIGIGAGKVRVAVSGYAPFQTGKALTIFHDWTDSQTATDIKNTLIPIKKDIPRTFPTEIGSPVAQALEEAANYVVDNSNPNNFKLVIMITDHNPIDPPGTTANYLSAANKMRDSGNISVWVFGIGTITSACTPGCSPSVSGFGCNGRPCTTAACEGTEKICKQFLNTVTGEPNQGRIISTWPNLANNFPVTDVVGDCSGPDRK